MPAPRLGLDPPPTVPDLRARRVLRLLPAPARPRACPCHRSPDRAIVRAGRGLALVLCRRDLRLNDPAGRWRRWRRGSADLGQPGAGLDEQPEYGEGAFPFLR